MPESCIWWNEVTNTSRLCRLLSNSNEVPQSKPEPLGMNSRQSRKIDCLAFAECSTFGDSQRENSDARHTINGRIFDISGLLLFSVANVENDTGAIRNRS